jgi:Pyruvate/2-oxoacid:ferredoxin oxidoreductase delta subunit
MLRRSTRAFFREARSLQGYSLFDFIHGYVYGRWPYFYIAVGTGEHRLTKVVRPISRAVSRLLRTGEHGRKHVRSRQHGGGNGARERVTFADTYHGKVVPFDAAARLVTVGRDVHLTELEHVIPYAMARDIVLRNPDHIALLQCPCRSARKNPCTPLDVCILVGEPIAGFILDHHPQRSRRITPAEAVEILRQEDARGHVHHAFFKDAMLGRFYAICNCCKCCCGAMQAHRQGIPMLASSGFIARVHQELCAACGTCSKYCQFDAVRFVDGVKTVDEEKCMGCGVCVTKCRQNAITLQREPSKGAPLEITELMQMALANESVAFWKSNTPA